MAHKQDKVLVDGKADKKSTQSERTLVWLNVNLDESDASALASLDYGLDSLASGFVSLAVEGWDVSLKRHGADGSFMATAIINHPNDELSRVGISGWSDNFPDAISSLLYKIHDKLGGDVTTATPTSTRRFR